MGPFIGRSTTRNGHWNRGDDVYNCSVQSFSSQQSFHSVTAMTAYPQGEDWFSVLVDANVAAFHIELKLAVMFRG
jgi:hypothetical protein